MHDLIFSSMASDGKTRFHLPALPSSLREPLILIKYAGFCWASIYEFFLKGLGLKYKNVKNTNFRWKSVLSSACWTLPRKRRQVKARFSTWCHGAKNDVMHFAWSKFNSSRQICWSLHKGQILELNLYILWSKN